MYQGNARGESNLDVVVYKSLLPKPNESVRIPSGYCCIRVLGAWSQYRSHTQSEDWTVGLRRLLSFDCQRTPRRSPTYGQYVSGI